MLSTPVRRFVLGAAAVSLTVPGALLAASPATAERPAIVLATPDTEPPGEPAEPIAAQPEAPGDPAVDDDNGWLWFLVLLALLIAGVAIVVSFLGRSDRSGRTGGGSIGPEVHREQHNIMGTAQWFHDQLSVQLIASPPEQALARWQFERQRVQTIAAAAHRQAIDADDPWHLLANSVLLLSGALDTLLGLQVQHPRNDAAVKEAADLAAARQQQLQALLVTMWPMVQTP